MGDSITEAPDGYVTVMRNLISAVYPERAIEVLNAGVSGNRVVDMLARLDRDVIQAKPDWVTVNVGINDVWHGANGVSLEQYEPLLKQLVQQLQHDTNAQIVLVTPTIIGEDISSAENITLNGYVEAMERVSRQLNVHLAPMHQEFIRTLERGHSANPNFSLTTDGVHMNPIGNHVMAMILLRFLGF